MTHWQQNLSVCAHSDCCNFNQTFLNEESWEMTWMWRARSIFQRLHLDPLMHVSKYQVAALPVPPRTPDSTAAESIDNYRPEGHDNEDLSAIAGKVSNRFTAVARWPYPAGLAPWDITNMARACSFSQVISSRQGGTTTNHDAPLHWRIEK